MGLWMLAAASAAVAQPATTCPAYVGQKVTPSEFEDVAAKLPDIPPRDAYESSADYERRLAQAPPSGASLLIVRRRPQHPGEGFSYDPDRKVLTVYDSAFGASQVNFSDVFHDAFRKGVEDFANAVGFMVGVNVTDARTYEANNGFGAKVTVTSTERQVQTIWERAGKPGENPIVGTRSGRVAQLSMEPEPARDLIEHGSTALLFVPRAPYRATGQSTIAPDFQRPRERHDKIDVIIADVKCWFLLNSADTVFEAFVVK